MQSLFSHYTQSKEEEAESREVNAYDTVFGRRVVKRMKDKTCTYVERLTFNEFKQRINWENSQ